MSVRNAFTLAISLALLLLLALSSQATTHDHLPYPTEPLWTSWDAQRYDLADDGQFIWIAAAGGIIRWDKTTATAHHITALDGLPHSDVFAVAVDPAGNRWFGGDAGLSRLDPSAVWTHYNTDNSDLPGNLIDVIAVNGDGTLWLSHGLPGGAVSQRMPDGTLTWYPNRQAAVVQAYAQIKETLNVTDLWTIFGDEIWLGYSVFDGVTWQERLPPGTPATDPIVRAAGNAVYAMPRNSATIYAWNGAGWSSYALSTAYVAYGDALVVGPDDGAWVAWQRQVHPYTLGYSQFGISRLPEKPGEVDIEHHLDVSTPASALLTTADGVWGAGAGWFMQPDWMVSLGQDGPAAEQVGHALFTTDGALFVQSGIYVQTMDDQGTTIFDDDRWRVSEQVARRLTAIERLPDGGLWLASYDSGRTCPCEKSLRYHQGAWIEFPLSAHIYDIFAQNARVTWFAYGDWTSDARGVKRLDDGGTPADFSDDVWTDYPIHWEGDPQAIAVDSLGQIWAANGANVYYHDGNTWQPYQTTSQVCDLVPLDGGPLIIHFNVDCDLPFNHPPEYPRYAIHHPNGLGQYTTLDDLVREEFDRIVATPHRNRLWTVAPDGAVWVMSGSSEGLVRYDGAHTTTYDLPFAYYEYQGGPLEVDENNHVWLVNDGLLWRLSPTPGFILDSHAWLLAPGSTRQRAVTVHSIGGYSGPVTLALNGLPSGVTAAFAPNPLPVGATTQLTLTVDPTVAPATYAATLYATDGDLTQSAPFTIIIAPTVHDLYAPLAAHP